MTLPELIRTNRKLLGLSQAELGRRCGYHTQFVSNMERGLSLLPVDKIPRMAAALGITPMTLLDSLCDEWRQQAIRTITKKGRK